MLVRISLAISTALTAGVLLGGSASATTLCTVNMTTCPMVSRYFSGQSVTGTLVPKTNSVFAYEGSTITCKSATLGLKTSANFGTPLPGSATTWSFEGGACEHSLLINPCSKKESLNLPYEAQIEATGGGGGNLKLKSSGNGPPAVWFVCENLINCVLEKSEIVLSVAPNGAGTAIATAKGLTFKNAAGGANCRKEPTTWNVEYELSPSPLYIVASP